MIRAILLSLALVACDRPTEPPEPTGTYEGLLAWFEGSNIIHLPEELPPEPVDRTAPDEPILGDGYVDGRVDIWDLYSLWVALFTDDEIDLEFDNLDINRDGRVGPFDMELLADYLYGSKENDYGIGERPSRG